MGNLSELLQNIFTDMKYNFSFSLSVYIFVGYIVEKNENRMITYKEILFTLLFNYINLTNPLIDGIPGDAADNADDINGLSKIELCRMMDEEYLNRETLNGKVVKNSPNDWEIHCTDDNEDLTLSTKYRTWWHVKFEGVDTEDTSEVDISGLGWPIERSMPVYSYDNINWHRMDESVMPENSELVKIGRRKFFTNTFRKQFSFDTVWIAKYYPYPIKRLNNLINEYIDDPLFSVDTIGISPQYRPLQMITLKDTSSDERKKSIWVHARTHPSETGSSFAAEGMIKTLLSPEYRGALEGLNFYIIPIYNVDGVALGNSRTNSLSQNLESLWKRPELSPKSLYRSNPIEVLTLYSTIRKLRHEGDRFYAALNLHSCNDPINASPFALSHFKKKREWQGDRGENMWYKQSRFISLLNDEYYQPVKVRLQDTSKTNLTMNSYPESWWWMTFEDRVMAITLETTEGKVNKFDDWVSYEDQIEFGAAIARAIVRMYYRPFPHSA